MTMTDVDAEIRETSRERAARKLAAVLFAQSDAETTNGDIAIIQRIAGLAAVAIVVADSNERTKYRALDRLSKFIEGNAQQLGSWARTQEISEHDNAVAS